MPADERDQNENAIDDNLCGGITGRPGPCRGQTGVQRSEGEVELQYWRQLGQQSQAAGRGGGPGGDDQGPEGWSGRKVRFNRSGVARGPQRPESGASRQN